MPLANFDPLVRDWFASQFRDVTEPQRLGWPEIQAGHDVLISAPTGSGKTLAAFLTAIDGLARRAREGELPNRTEVLYVSPLKALSNDIHKNLEVPLAGVAEQARLNGVTLAPIRTAVRTGDTSAHERARMAKQAPHILVTTPESLYILLTAERPRQMLASVRTLIVDEIHAVADDKRGSHLALSIARLERLAGAPLQKIGLSATVSPMEDVARFLSDEARIVQIGHRRAMDLAVEVPRDEMGAVATNEMWGEIYDRIADLARENRTTLVFVNTRKLSERVAHNLSQRLGEAAVLPHHGSLSRTLRLEAEQRLKRGELRAVVATASLELGIDIGTVDLACQIGSPRSIAVALQRVGRAGHWVGALPKGRFFPTTRDELIECAALVRAIRRGELDKLEIPRAPLDILAQQMVAACACEEFGEDELFSLMQRAAPYRDLARRDFDAVLDMLSEGIATSRGRRSAYLHRDRVNRCVRGRRGARLVAITSGGAIPDTSQYQVIAEPEGTLIGSLDEDFAVESMAGDIFLLGTTSWKIRRIEPGRVRVENARGAAPSIPFWLGEAPGRTRELSLEISQLREQTADSHDPVTMLQADCGLDQRGAEQAAEYVRAGKHALGVVPTQDTVVAERFFDEGGGMQLVLHAPFGARINKAWGLALRKRFCRAFNFELQAAATDNGLVLSLSEPHSFPLELVFSFLKTTTVEHVLTQALLDSPMFGARWKWNAARALAVPRFAGGRKVPPPIQRMRADDLLASVFPDQAACAENLTGEIRIPDHPLVRETIGNCLHEAMDLDGLIEILDRMGEGTLRTVAVDTREPSPFCHELLKPTRTRFSTTPSLPNGKTDFGGKGVWAPIWVLDWSDAKYVDKAVDVPFTAWGLATFQERRANLSKDDPEGYCLPPGVPRYTGTPYPFQIIQLPDRVVILYEGASHMYRTVFMDGRRHSKDLNPTWLGESNGRWEGNDTLVVDTIGFNGRTWLGYVGHPATEALHVVEKFRRPDYLTLAYEATIEDANAYTKPWTTSFKVTFRPGWDLLEYVCLENNKDLQHLGTTEPK